MTEPQKKNDAPEAPRAQCHPDRPERARGLCGPCYYADLKAKKAAEALARAPVNSPKTQDAAVADLEKDPEAKKRFYKMMWEWLEATEVPAIYKLEGGRRTRDYATEAKLAEVAQRKADKAATVLGRAYVVEKREEVKPTPLPLGKEIDDSGWEGGGGDENESNEVSGDGEE